MHSQHNNKFLKDWLVQTEFEIHTLTENLIFISVFSGIYVSGEIEKEVKLSMTTPSREELNELVFIFLLTSVLCPRACTGGR